MFLTPSSDYNQIRINVTATLFKRGMNVKTSKESYPRSAKAYYVKMLTYEQIDYVNCLKIKVISEV